jgi:hypothetical protein
LGVSVYFFFIGLMAVCRGPDGRIISSQACSRPSGTQAFSWGPDKITAAFRVFP